MLALLFFRMLNRLLSCIHNHDFDDGIAGLQRFLPGQTKLPRLDQGIFHLLDRSTDRGFADPIGWSNIKSGAIFSPAHQRNQQLIRSAQLGRTSKTWHLSFQHSNHLSEGVVFDPCQLFEVFIASLFNFFVSHVPIMAQFLLMQEV
jgi:hypothetical protein